MLANSSAAYLHWRFAKGSDVSLGKPVTTGERIELQYIYQNKQICAERRRAVCDSN